MSQDRSPSDPLGLGLHSISAVTLATRDMARAVGFYRALGFGLVFGGEQAEFTSLSFGRSHLNLLASPALPPLPAWGRIIFYVEHVDAFLQHVCALGWAVDGPPQDAPWGERYFHMNDPDGHPLSFCWPLPGDPKRANL